MNEDLVTGNEFKRIHVQHIEICGDLNFRQQKEAK